MSLRPKNQKRALEPLPDINQEDKPYTKRLEAIRARQKAARQDVLRTQKIEEDVTFLMWGDGSHDEIDENDEYNPYPTSFTSTENENADPTAAFEAAEATAQELYKLHPEAKTQPAPIAVIDPKAWIQTYTGKKFYPQNPTLESICIEDIAHALSHQCRFTGHTSVHYSVAQHSVLVSYLCNEENQLYGLLHDGSEFALTDIASPIKKLPELSGYRALEKKVQTAICHRFGLSKEEPKDVKRADLIMLSIESQTFLSPLHPDWKMPVLVPALKIEPLSAREAERLFLNRFKELYTWIP